MNKTFLDTLEYKITGACIEVHKLLGPGLLEKTYQRCLIKELEMQSVNFIAEKSICICYKGEFLDASLKADLLVENCIIVELKAVEVILPIHEAQVLTYMKLMQVPKGLLINFNCTNIIQHGKKSFVNELMYKFNP
ncbi:GxxExxY protein [Pedobacter sp. BMA]|uniref:GxxExxY protein n=1 Tax=Pedobacter sp. BMA TaxID=1663685 RepID=UPI000649C685|nr:GxxExxY protein [Pedobacter sp. BMA]KLT67283.1 GxxExxY protein [Pedobacter sp. BMA]